MGQRFAFFLFALTLSLAAAAQGYPGYPVRLLVPSVAGGPSDFVARMIAPKLSVALGRNVVVDARGSVSGIVAAEIAAKAAPDRRQVQRGHRQCSAQAGNTRAFQQPGRPADHRHHARGLRDAPQVRVRVLPETAAGDWPKELLTTQHARIHCWVLMPGFLTSITQRS